MGGVHASMIGGLSKHEVAVSPHLTPRSGTVAFCEGAMNSAIAFQQLSEAEVTCEYILRVADSLRHKPDFGKIPPRCAFRECSMLCLLPAPQIEAKAHAGALAIDHES